MLATKQLLVLGQFQCTNISYPALKVLKSSTCGLYNLILSVNTFGATGIPLDYLAGTGQFLGCFYRTARYKIECRQKYLFN